MHLTATPSTESRSGRLASALASPAPTGASNVRVMSSLPAPS
jgi:hypothetical protein